jgi:circadian clock protein KaiA
LQPRIHVCALLFSHPLTDALVHQLGGDGFDPSRPNRYILSTFEDQDTFLEFVALQGQQVDCLMIQSTGNLQDILEQLHQRAVLLPILILQSKASELSDAGSTSLSQYHDAVQYLSTDDVEHLPTAVEDAINTFLKLSSTVLPSDLHTISDETTAATRQSILSIQQRRLSEKLKERLGYLGVYYKRNPANFFRHMTESQRQELLQQLRAEYREIILNYFSDDATLNDKIDNFVNQAFFADVSVSQIVAIHMELMDEFSKQLKLEGRSDEILLDYRLTLIDAIAHLCEMYRRSIPREA